MKRLNMMKNKKNQGYGCITKNNIMVKIEDL